MTACEETRGSFCFASKTVVQKYECMALDIMAPTAAEGSRTTVAEGKRSDHELIEAARNGDEDAFAEIVARYRNPITNFLYRFLNDYDEAVDLAQETFVRVYFAIDRYHTQFAFSTYIYRIATNLAISELRRRKRRRLLSLTGLFQNDEDGNVEFQLADNRQLQDLALVEDERSDVIARAIASLPEKYRIAVILRDVEGRSYEEIAEIMD